MQATSAESKKNSCLSMNGSRFSRFEFIEGLRGVAAMQVVVLHYCSAFFPGLARISSTTAMDWERIVAASPLFFLINGNVAVFVFFLMSGFVLSQSFTCSIQSHQTVARLALKRYMRLFLPVACSIVIASALIALIPDAKHALEGEIPNNWVSTLYSTPQNLGSIFKEVVLSSLLIGYQGGSIFDGLQTLGFPLSALTTSLNAPIWTLHAELWGSLLVLLFVWVRASAPVNSYRLFVVASLLVTGTSHFTLFTIGFLAYTHRDYLLANTNPTRTIVGVLLLAAAVWTGSKQPMPLFSDVLRSARSFTLLYPLNEIRLQNEVSATMLMASVVGIQSIRRALSYKLPLWLGKVSFALYLTHFPILFTVTIAFFAMCITHFGYGLSTLIASLCGLSVTLVAAILFERFVDRPTIRISRYIVRQTESASTVEYMAAGRQSTSSSWGHSIQQFPSSEIQPDLDGSKSK